MPLTVKDMMQAANAVVERIDGARAQALVEEGALLLDTWLVFLYVGLPLLIVTGLMDLAMQLFFGVCTGIWCLA